MKRSQFVLIVVGALVAAACGSSGITTSSTAVGSSGDEGSVVTSTTETLTTSSLDIAPASTTAPRPSGTGCAVTDGARPLSDADSVALERIYEGDGLTIDGAFYPHPGYEGNPWSQWGQGLVADNGRYYSAIGDHLGSNGNSYVYEYDPDSGNLVLVTDVLSQVEHTDGAWGYGKIHAQMSSGPCGEVFYATYWGSRRGLSYADGYTGDILFHIDPYERTVVNHGVPEPERGFPTMAGAPEHGLIYTIAVEPTTDTGTFLAIEASTTEVVFSSPSQKGYRSIAVDRDGLAYFTSVDGRLAVYDPEANAIVDEIDAPGVFIRAADTLADGTIVGVMRNPDTFFSISGGELTPLGDAIGYTTSVAVASDGGEFFYLPGAHGNAAANGAILKAVDLTTGTERDVIALADIVFDHFGATLGGTYNLVVDRDANRLYLGLNVDPSGGGGGFGEVVFLVIGLP